MTELSLRGITKAYAATTVLHPTDLEVAQGEFVTVLGPSGCGKTTLLRILAGITAPSGGEIHLRGKRIDALPPEKRDIAMVFQSYALFPHMSVAGNLGFGLRMRKVAAIEQRKRIAHAVEICNLGGLLERMPRELSGGQQQRVALARAIVMQPALLLFDEPLSNLDAQLRDSLRRELTALHRRVGTTSLYVTHDQAEAMAMSDRVVLMNAGRVVEVGTPIELYREPAHAFTAQFLGHTNLLRVSVQGPLALLPWGALVPLRPAPAGADDLGAEALVSLRPEDIRIHPQTAGPGLVTSMSFAGAQVNYVVQVAGVELRVSCAGNTLLLEPGARVGLDFGVPLRALQGNHQNGGLP